MNHYSPNERKNPSPPSSAELHDVQGDPDDRGIPIKHVGVKGVRFPVRIGNADNQPTVATFDMYASLASSCKGTHMSRFLEILENFKEIPLSPLHVENIAQRMSDRLESSSSRLSVSFPLFMEKRAPVTGASAVLDYACGFSVSHKKDPAESRVTAIATVPVTTLCPCSKAISAYGAHNQRGEICVKMTLKNPSACPSFYDIIRIVEKEASCELYPILKRADEKYVTERAYDHPVFVEDIVRNIALHVRDIPHISYYSIEAENFESIHNHSAYAFIEQSIEV